MSKRIRTWAGVIQRENFTSAPGSSSSIAASSRSSRIAAARWAPSPSPSSASTAPPGNTHTPPMKRACGVRLTSSTSSCSPPRSRITVAACRGGVAGPGLYSSPDARMPALPARAHPLTLPAGSLQRMSTSTKTLQRWICESCGFIYDPEEGDPDGGIPRGPPSRTSPTPGSARCAARASATSSCTRTRAPLSDWDELLAFDREHVWHPYGALPGALAPLPVVSAQGVRLTLADGRELIDGMASWWCAIHGYRHPVLDGALVAQLGRMAHVMFGGLTHEPGVRLAERLLELAPPGLQAVFFADSGSVSVEVAIKMSLQFQRARGDRGRTRLLTVRGGYHGDTFGAMAVCDPVGGMHSLFTGVLAEHVFAERPPDGFDAGLDERWAAGVSELVARHSGELAAIIVEPVVQGAGGMRFHSPACLTLLRRLCDEHGLLLVLDEIATGFGRTGALFAAEHAGVART